MKEMELQNTEKLKHLIMVATLGEKAAVINDIQDVIFQKQS